MATVLSFLLNRPDFDDEATRIMGEAFDAACKGLQDGGQPDLVREIIAKRIIEAAQKGERCSLTQSMSAMTSHPPVGTWHRL